MDEGTYQCATDNKKEDLKFRVVVVDPPPTPYQCHTVMEEGDQKFRVLCTSDYVSKDQFHFELRLVGSQVLTEVVLRQSSQPSFDFGVPELRDQIGSNKGAMLVVCVVHVQLEEATACGEPVNVDLDDTSDTEIGPDSRSSLTKLIVPVTVCGGIILCAVIGAVLIWKFKCKKRNRSESGDEHNTLTSERQSAIHEGESNPALLPSTSDNDRGQDISDIMDPPSTKLTQPNARFTVTSDTWNFRHHENSLNPSDQLTNSGRPRSRTKTSTWYDGLTDDQKRLSLEMSKEKGDNHSDLKSPLTSYGSIVRTSSPLSINAKVSTDLSSINHTLKTTPSLQDPDLIRSSSTDISETGAGQDANAKIHYYKIPRSDDKVLVSASLPMRLKTTTPRRHTIFPDCPNIYRHLTDHGLSHQTLSSSRILYPQHFPNFDTCPKHYSRTLDASDRSRSLFSLQFIHHGHTGDVVAPETEEDAVWQVVPPDLDLPPKLKKKTKPRSSFFKSSSSKPKLEETIYDIPRITSDKTSLSQDESCSSLNRDRPYENLIPMPKLYKPITTSESPDNKSQAKRRRLHRSESDSSKPAVEGQRHAVTQNNVRSSPELRRSKSLSFKIGKHTKHFKRYWNKGDLLRPSHARIPHGHAKWPSSRSLHPYTSSRLDTSLSSSSTRDKGSMSLTKKITMYEKMSLNGQSATVRTNDELETPDSKKTSDTPESQHRRWKDEEDTENLHRDSLNESETNISQRFNQRPTSNDAYSGKESLHSHRPYRHPKLPQAQHLKPMRNLEKQSSSMKVTGKNSLDESSCASKDISQRTQFERQKSQERQEHNGSVSTQQKNIKISEV